MTLCFSATLPKRRPLPSSIICCGCKCRHRRRSVAVTSLGVSSVLPLLLLTVCCLAPAAAADEAAKDMATAFRFPTNEQRLRGFVGDVDGNDVIVKTTFGKLRGKQRPGQPLAGGETWLVDWFLGVPYAKPPTGPLRFQATVPPESWSGTKDAIRFSRICPQLLRETLLYGEHDEDCLYLNIYSPATATAAQTRSVPSAESLYPVMVYIHGGSYRVGTGNVFQGHMLAQYGVVVVTVNYRLGVLGFLSARDESLEGNYGLYDQIASLEWIRQNIAEFRGDRDRVTIFGNSAGGASVGLLAVSPKAKGLFQHAIIQSGSPLSFWAVHNDSADLASYVRSLADDVWCDHNRFIDLVACLRQVSWKQLFHSASKMSFITPSATDLRPVPDGKVIPEMPRKRFSAGRFTGRSLMIGIVAGEMTKHMGLLFHRDLINTNIDLNFDDGFERASFIRVIRYVICVKFGLDDVIADLVLHRYTNWTHGNISDPYENRRQYVNFLTDLAMWAPSFEVASSVVASQPGLPSPPPPPPTPTFVYTMQLEKQSADSSKEDDDDEEDDEAWMRNHHQLELNYVFGSPFTGIDVDELSVRDSYTEEDRNISRLMMTLWTNFAKTGNPSLSGGSPNDTSAASAASTASSSSASASSSSSSSSASADVVNWTEFRRETGDYLRIVSTSATMQTHHRTDFIAFWNDLIVTINHRIQMNKDNRLLLSMMMTSAEQQQQRSRHDWVTLVSLVVSIVQLTIICLFLIIFPIKKMFCKSRR